MYTVCTTACTALQSHDRIKKKDDSARHGTLMRRFVCLCVCVSMCLIYSLRTNKLCELIKWFEEMNLIKMLFDSVVVTFQIEITRTKWKRNKGKQMKERTKAKKKMYRNYEKQIRTTNKTKKRKF